MNMARELRDQFIEALRNGGYGELATRREVRDWTDSAIGLAIIGVGPIGWAAFSVGAGVPWPFAVAAALTAIALLVVAIGADWFGDDAAVGLAVVLTLSSPSALIATGEWRGLAVTLGLAAVTMLVLFVVDRFDSASIGRTVRAVKSALTDVPLLFPLVTLVIFALILSNEIWQIAGDEDALRLVFLAGVVIAPVTWFLRRRLVRSIDESFTATAQSLPGEGDDILKLVVRHATSVGGHKRARWIEDNARAHVQRSFDAEDLKEFAATRCGLLRARFKRRISIRLTMTVIAVGMVAFVIIYTLAVMLISEGVARCWSFVPDDGASAGANAAPCGTAADGMIPHVTVAGQSLPLGPYLRVAILLAILACAIFVAFVITTNDVCAQFHAAYIEEPALTALLLAVPYVAAERILGTADVPGEPRATSDAEPIADAPGDLGVQPA